MFTDVKKVVLAYSGGLDTSVILKWLVETYRCEVIAFSADIGQAEELSGIEEKAMKTGASKVYIDDLTEDFVSNYVFPAFRANVIYEGQYLWEPPLRARSSQGGRWKSLEKRGRMLSATGQRERGTTRSVSSCRIMPSIPISK